MRPRSLEFSNESLDRWCSKGATHKNFTCRVQRGVASQIKVPSR